MTELFDGKRHSFKPKYSREQIIALAKQGISRRQIQARTGISESMLRLILKEAGLGGESARKTAP